MKDLATVAAVSQLLKSQGLLCVVNGSVKQITMENLMNSMNIGQSQLLRQVAWGTFLEENSTCQWSQIGNLQMRDLYYSTGGRYMMKNDGRAAKMNRLNSAYFDDGTAVNDTAGHTMVYRPEFYYLVTEENGKKILWQSMIPIGGKKEPARWIGAYKGAFEGSTLVSKPGLDVKGSITMSAFWTGAQVNGAEWGLMNYPMQRGEVMRLLGKYANTNAQSMIGKGLDGTGSSYDNCRNIKTGLTKSLGDASGAVNTTDAVGATVQQVSFDGIEGLWGQVWEFRPGIVSNGATVYIYDANKVANDKPPVGVEYRTQTRILESGGSYVVTQQLGEFFDIIPKTIGGGSTSGWADGYWSSTAGELWLFGGNAAYGSLCGLSAADAYCAFSFAYSSVGARLAFYGVPKIVTGKQLMTV